MCAEKDHLRSPRAHWQKTAVCPSSRSALRCPGTLPARRSGPQRGGTIWYQLPSGRGASVPSSLLSVKVMLAAWSQAFPRWLAGWLADISRSYPSCHTGEGLYDLETGPGSSLLLCCRLFMRRWMEARFVWLVTERNMCCMKGTCCDVFLACLYCGQVDWAHRRIVSGQLFVSSNRL